MKKQTMSKTDWYRNTDWNKEIEEYFFTRLNKSRSSFNKAQYLRIQAYHLQTTKKKQNIIAALNLLELLIANYPEPTELASAYQQKAKCHIFLENFKLALDAYRAGMKAEKSKGSIKSNSKLDFGWFAITQKMINLYDEVLSNMDIPEHHLLFPADQFKFASIYAIILKHKKNYEQAKIFATMALEAMRKEESPFRYHKKIGLVRNPEESIIKELREILNL